MTSKMFTTLLVLAVTISATSGRSVAPPDSPDSKPSGGGNIILLEAPVSGDSGQKVHFEGDKLLLEGRNFSSLNEMVNILEEDKKGKEADPEGPSDSFSIVVPVARKFSSLKELFEILGEDSDSKAPKDLEPSSQSYVKGSEANSSDYTIFFTS